MKHTTLRIATLDDAQELLKIYSYYVENTAITFEYEAPTLEEFEQRMRGVLAKYPYLIAEQDGKIIGYAYAGTFKTRAAYQWNVETTIYIDKDCKQRGIGKMLYGALEEILKAQHVLNMNACIAYPKEEDEYLTMDSVHFHERLGYRMVGEFHQSGYKHKRWYNMVWMEKSIDKHVECPQPVLPFPELEPTLVETICKKYKGR